MSTPIPLPALLTKEEVADVFRVSTQTVRKWARQGRIKAVKTPGGLDYRFRRADVEALLAEPDAVPAEEAS